MTPQQAAYSVYYWSLFEAWKAGAIRHGASAEQANSTASKTYFCHWAEAHDLPFPDQTGGEISQAAVHVWADKNGLHRQVVDDKAPTPENAEPRPFPPPFPWEKT